LKSECPYEVGDKVRFKPSAYASGCSPFGGNLDITVLGTVERVHEAHRWYRTCWDGPQGPMYECFKF
jgi:hypothetical protein